MNLDRGVKLLSKSLFVDSIKNLQFLNDNYDRLVKEYNNKWIIIHKQKVIKSEDTSEEALSFARRYDPNSILMKYMQAEEIAMFF